MTIERRSFLRFSAVGAAAFVLPLAGTGCTGPVPVVHEVGGAGEHLYFDARGSVLTLQPAQHRVLVHGPEGALTATLGGFGQGPEQLNGPAALALGREDQMYVVDRGNSRVQVYSRGGVHLGQIGQPGKRDGQFLFPAGACVDASGRLLVSDSLNHRVQVFSPEGSWLGTFGQGELNLPRGIAVGPDGRVHVVDSGNARVAVYDGSGRALGHYGHYGHEAEGMIWPRSIAVDAAGTAYVADVTCGAVHVFAEDGSFIERLALHRSGASAAPVHLTLSPTGELRVAARAAGPV